MDTEAVFNEACTSAGVWPKDIDRAAKTLEGYAVRTEVVHSAELTKWLCNDESSSTEFYFKCENAQKTGSFKLRGAFNAASALDSSARTLVTHSSGNHGHAVAAAAKNLGMTAHIVLPATAPENKIEALKKYGAKVTMVEATMEARQAATDKIVENDSTAKFIHSSDNAFVMAGQGTVAEEFIEQAGPLDAVVISVGGGGLFGGCAIASKHADLKTKVYGAEPEVCNAAAKSLELGKRVATPYGVETVADGVRVSLKEKGWQVLKRLAEEVICVSEDETIEAMKVVWETLNIAVEGSAAVAVAAARKAKLGSKGFKRVGIVLCGGNIGKDSFLSIIENHDA